MNRRNILALAGVMIAAMLLTVPADARQVSGSATGTIVKKSWKCGAQVKPYDFASWACTTIIVPKQVDAGDTASITFMFKAKTKMKYVDVCFGKVNSLKCAYRHKYVQINKGATIKRVLKMPMPMVSKSVTYTLDNYTRFYKPPQYGHNDMYWSARSYFCVVASGDEDFQCQLGK